MNKMKTTSVPEQMMQKLGPCPKCQMHLKPCRCHYEDKCAELEKKYYELIYAVAKKFKGETRHETALRYINRAEVGYHDTASYYDADTATTESTRGK